VVIIIFNMGLTNLNLWKIKF